MWFEGTGEIQCAGMYGGKSESRFCGYSGNTCMIEESLGYWNLS